MEPRQFLTSSRDGPVSHSTRLRISDSAWQRRFKFWSRPDQLRCRTPSLNCETYVRFIHELAEHCLDQVGDHGSEGDGKCPQQLPMGHIRSWWPRYRSNTFAVCAAVWDGTGLPGRRGPTAPVYGYPGSPFSAQSLGSALMEAKSSWHGGAKDKKKKKKKKKKQKKKKSRTGDCSGKESAENS